jgi:nucleotide-binding universal stress UspA family protein
MQQFQNILYPINLDSKNISTVNKALEIARSLNSSVHILYVNDEGAGYRYPTDREDAVALKVQEVVPAELLNSLKITYAVSKGQLGQEILLYCKKNRIDLIITGHKHRNKLYSNLFDSPDVNIIDSIPVPVLVIPKK